jgi:hypothetical protein
VGGVGGDAGGRERGQDEDEDADGTLSASSGERSEHLHLKALGLLGLGLSEGRATGQILRWRRGVALAANGPRTLEPGLLDSLVLLC